MASDTATLLALIERLEQAPEGSRELDYEIFIFDSVVPEASQSARELASLLPRPMPDHAGFWPTYTTSIDAALSLVPEGQWNGEIFWNFGELAKGGYVELNLANPEWLKPDCDPSQTAVHAACVNSYEDQEPNRHSPRPFALALCIAALRARVKGGERT